LLPSGVPFGSHEVDGDGVLLEEKHTSGHNVVETFLARNGRIFQKRVHYSSDDFLAEKRNPDEVLGEASAELYSWAYEEGLRKLGWLKRKADSVFSAEIHRSPPNK
jgi:hypothetical protein